MRCFSILFIVFSVHLVQAAIDDENNPNEIPNEDPSEPGKVDSWDNTFIFPDDDLEEIFIFSEDSDYEEIKSMTINKYIQFSNETSGDDESNSYMSSKDTFKRNKKNSAPKPIQDKIKVRKKRETCPNMDEPTLNCDPDSKYRTIDGSCNNLKNPTQGMAMGCQQRFLKANYEGETGFRISVTGVDLPPPRNLSLNINTDETRLEIRLNIMSVFFGQFYAHDMVLTPLFANDTGEILSCCQPNLRNDSRCANVYTTKEDPFYGPLNRSCLNNPRAVACNSCDKNGRLMLNLNTAFIDGSLIYGSSINVSVSLRRNDGSGKLISQPAPDCKKEDCEDRGLLPNSSDPQHDQCSFPQQDRICFTAGDLRRNQHIMITILQTTFMRFHNRVASMFKKYNPSWGEEKVFQEARRFVGASIQVILYKEYLPIVLSPQWISRFELSISADFTTYDDTLDPSIWVEFSTAAFRVPHSSVQSLVSIIPRLVTEGKQYFRDLYSRPFGLRVEGYGKLIVDSTIILAQQTDRYAVNDTNDYLYRKIGDPGGLDLSSIDIQRGRDNGLPTYVQMVKFCSGTEITNFKGLQSFMSESNAELLERNYKSVYDIDLETAMMMESKEKGSIFGPTSACIVAIQFKSLKFGDRYYFQHENQSGSFTKDQMHELNKTTLTEIFCNNVDGILALPKNAMLIFDLFKNPAVFCKDVEKPDYSKWKE